LTLPVRFDEDFHVHSTFSDDAVSTVAENVAAARQRGLRTVGLAEHVRRDSAQVPEFLAAVAVLPPTPGLRVLAGVEAKILDSDGQLDLPASIAGVDLLLIADHQFPSPGGPLHPREVRASLSAGKLSAAEAVECLVSATASALRTARDLASHVSLAHLFSILPKVGLAEADVTEPQLRSLAATAARTGALVEVNEKWGCPSAASLRAFAAAGVPIVASTDSHDCAGVGVYDRVVKIAGGEATAGVA
jgi:putative hydrolase